MKSVHYSMIIDIEITKDIQWDNCRGGYATVFKKGDVVKANLWDTNTVSAESPYYVGVSDQIYPDQYKAI